MEASAASTRFAALGNPLRLAIFRLLVEAGQDGLNAGDLSAAMRLPAPTLSFHLAHLTRAGLILGKAQGRFIRYQVDFTALDELIRYLTEHCCQGAPCLPVQHPAQ